MPEGRGQENLKSVYLKNKERSSKRLELAQISIYKGFPGGLVGKKKNLFAMQKDPGSIPGLGRSPGEGHGNPLPYSCLENSLDREDWWATVLGVARVDLETKPPPPSIYRLFSKSWYIHIMGDTHM